MAELARYLDGPACIVIARDGDELVFWTDHDGSGRPAACESRMPLADFVARGQGPWPWYDLGARRVGVLRVLAALGVEPPDGQSRCGRTFWTCSAGRTVAIRR